jgi:hypothetical protein
MDEYQRHRNSRVGIRIRSIGDWIDQNRPNITVLLPYVLSYGILLYNGYLEQQYKHLCKGSYYNTDLFKLFRYFDINSEYFQS